MPTTFQNLFRRWAEQNYKAMRKHMPLSDHLHSAYIAVYGLHNPYLPTPERFYELMDDAYHRFVLQEFNHNMQFLLPDPVFWMHAKENPELTDAFDNESTTALNDISPRDIRNIFSFVKSNFSEQTLSIFKMAVVEQRSVEDIAKITGLTKPHVRARLNDIECAIRKHHKPSKRKKQ